SRVLCLTRYRLDPRPHMLVKWRSGKPIAILAGRELIGRDAVLEFLSFTVRIPKSGSVRERDVPGQHAFGYFDHRLGAAALGNDTHASTTLHSELRGVLGIHPQRTLGIFRPPLRIANNGVGGRRAPLAG